MGMKRVLRSGEFRRRQSIRFIHRYLDAGGNFLDRADGTAIVRGQRSVVDAGLSCARVAS
jgi:hypothetical protein